MKCDVCGHDNLDKFKYCEICGNQLFAVCGACGFKNAGHLNFCGGCGKPLNSNGLMEGQNINPNAAQEFNRRPCNASGQQFDNSSYNRRQPNKPIQQPPKEDTLENNAMDKHQEKTIGQAVIIAAVLSAILSRIIFGYFIADLYYYDIISTSFHAALVFFEFVLCGLCIGIIYTYSTRGNDENAVAASKNIAMSSFISVLAIVFINLLDNNLSSHGFYIYMIVYALYWMLFAICAHIARYMVRPFLPETEVGKEEPVVIKDRPAKSCMMPPAIFGASATAIAAIAYYHMNHGNVLGYFMRFYAMPVLVGIIMGMVYSHLKEKRKDTQLRDIAIISFITTMAYVATLHLLGGSISHVNWAIFYMCMTALSGLLGACLHREYIGK